MKGLDPETYQIRVWLRTAIRAKVSTPRSFLSTLLHELCHHLDCAKLAWPGSFHTRGFWRPDAHTARERGTSPNRGVCPVAVEVANIPRGRLLSSVVSGESKHPRTERARMRERTRSAVADACVATELFGGSCGAPRGLTAWQSILRWRAGAP